MDQVLTSPISVVIMERDSRTVDRKLLKVWPAVSINLRIQVREDPTLEQRIFCEVDTSDNVTGLELRHC